MKEQTKSNLIFSMQSLGLIFLIFFVMAFACKNGGKGDTPQTYDRQDKTSTSNGRCSTETEFKNMISKRYADTSAQYARLREPELEFTTFRLGAATRYRNPQYGIDASPAYPVTTTYTVREYFKYGSETFITEKDYLEAKYTFYVDYKGDCVLAHEYLNSSETRKIPYDE